MSESSKVLFQEFIREGCDKLPDAWCRKMFHKKVEGPASMPSSALRPQSSRFPADPSATLAKAVNETAELAGMKGRLEADRGVIVPKSLLIPCSRSRSGHVIVRHTEEQMELIDDFLESLRKGGQRN